MMSLLGTEYVYFRVTYRDNWINVYEVQRRGRAERKKEHLKILKI